MVLTDSAMNRCKMVQSKVRAALVKSKIGVPYEYGEEVFFGRYEAIRAIWREGHPQRDIAENSQISRNTIQMLESEFIKNGAIGFLSEIDCIPVDENLERLAVLVKEARPHENASYVLTLANALDLPGATLEIIRAIHRSYGYGQRQDGADLDYFYGVQKIYGAVAYWKKAQQNVGHNKEHRLSTFFVFDRDIFQHLVELFRELSKLDKKRKIRPILIKYGVGPKRYYELRERYLHYGIFGLVNLVHTPRRKVEVMSSNLELKIIEERLMNPMSVDILIKKMELKCCRASVQKVFGRWKLSRFKRSVPVRGVVSLPEPEVAKVPEQSAISRFPDLIKNANLKVNAGFLRLRHHLKCHFIHLCNPGAIIIAPFMAQLGIIEALHTYGPETLRTTEMTNDIIHNVLRIICGYPTISSVYNSPDPSVMIGAGFAVHPTRSRYYESFDNLRFNHLQDLRNDAAIRAREIGIIEGKIIALDYHCDPTDSRYPLDKGFTKAPDKNGDVVYAHRPHIIWDSGTNSIINIAYCEGRSRAPTALFKFCEENLYKVIDRSAIREIYADSEYTGERQITYLIVTAPSAEVTMCLKQNPRILKWKAEILKEGIWEPYREKYRIASKDYVLPETCRSLRFIVKQEIETEETRCFGSTNLTLTPIQILDYYRIRWPVETGIKDLIENYYLNRPNGTSPEKVESHYYCVMLARMVIDYFLSVFRIPEFATPEDWKCVVSTLRTTIFASQSCVLGLHPSGDLLVKYLCADPTGIKSRLKKLLDDRVQMGINRVPWWGEIGVRIEIEDEYGSLKWC